MYRYFQPTTVPNDKHYQDLLESLKKHHISGEVGTYQNEKDLADKLNGSADSANTVVMIGGDVDFENLIGLSKHLPQDTAVGFLPFTTSRISHKMQLRNWSDGVDVLAQRRISEITIFSIGNRFFFDEIELHIDDVQTEFPITITADQALRLHSPQAAITIENLSSEQFRTKAPLQLQLFDNQSDQEIPSSFLELRKRIKQVSDKPIRQKIGQIHGKLFSIESAAELRDSYGRSYGSRLRVGQHSRSLRLITKRKTQL